MPVVHLRIDNRLIHGQVTVAWVHAVGADHMIVANDKVAQDPIQKMLLPQAARGVKTSVLSIDETVAYANSPKAEKEKIMVIAKLASDAAELIDKGLRPQEVNVGNQAPIPGTQYKMVLRSVAVTPEDAALYRKIAEAGYRITARMMPQDPARDFIKQIEEAGL